MTNTNTAARIAYLQREISENTNPPSYVDAGWAAQTVLDATEELRRLTYVAPPVTAEQLADYHRLYRGFHGTLNRPRTTAPINTSI